MDILLKVNLIDIEESFNEIRSQSITSIDGYTVNLDVAIPTDEIILKKNIKKYILEFIDQVNRNAYNELSSEYDDIEHMRTLLSIKASEEGFIKLSKFVNIYNILSTLEVGCGTGQLTNTILSKLDIRNLVSIDISEKMIKICKDKKRKGEFNSNVEFKIMSILNPSDDFLKNKFEMIACGLADPYLLPQSIKNMSNMLINGGFLFVSLPEPKYSLKERYERIGSDLYMTRYKLKNKSIVKCFSFIYNINDLKILLEKYNFNIIYYIDVIPSIKENIKLARKINKNPPKVTCILAIKMT